jgi:hypothetical protein
MNRPTELQRFLEAFAIVLALFAIGAAVDQLWQWCLKGMS